MEHSFHTFYKYVYGIFTATVGVIIVTAIPAFYNAIFHFVYGILLGAWQNHHHLYNVFKQQHISLRYSSDEHDKIFDQSSLIDFFNYAPDKGYSSYVAQWKCTLK
jgi:hypothetical protein